LGKPYGQRSRQSLAELCFQQTAHVEMIARDRYGRGGGNVECAGKDAGKHQVSAGMAWVYARYAPKDSPLYGIQTEAKAARRGLWVDEEPVPPWEWRRSKLLPSN
jgi:endonuclease YncB( thermonuclease family)